MQINRMNEKNICSVKAIEDECFSNPWSLDSLSAELSKVGAYFYVAEEKGVILGYVGFNTVLDEGYIVKLAVREKFRRRGVAKALLKKVIDNAIQMGISFISLEVRRSNISAVNLYKFYGFTLQGTRKNFYRNPTEDGLILTKFL